MCKRGFILLPLHELVEETKIRNIYREALCNPTEEACREVKCPVDDSTNLHILDYKLARFCNNV